MKKTAPLPILWVLHQSASHRIAMYVTQLLNPLTLAPHIEVVIPRLPKRTTLRKPQLSRDILLQHLQHNRQLSPLRFTDQKMNMLWHDHITVDIELIPASRLLQRALEFITRRRGSQQRLSVVAAECDEMQTPCFLKPLQSPRHAQKLDRLGGACL